MSTSNPKNIVASIEARLKNRAKEHSWNYSHLLTRYATERFLYRLSISPYRDQFILKGGNLFVIWLHEGNARPTIDTDLLRFGDASFDELKRIFEELCSFDNFSIDGMIYDASSIALESIRESTQYGGTRLVLIGYLGRSRSRLQFDIGVGDIVTPAAELEDFPVLLNGASPRLRTYPMASVIAEKAHIMISLGILNSRMKDYFDLWVLSAQFEHSYHTLSVAMRNTFTHRGEAFPAITAPTLMKEFTENLSKQTQWKAFLRRNGSLKTVPSELSKLMEHVSTFMLPLLTQSSPQLQKWTPEGGWK